MSSTESAAPTRDGETFVSVDVETSGPSPSTGSLISIGACLVVDPETSFYREIQPLPGIPWDPATEPVHGLTREHLERSGVPVGEAMAAFDAWLGQTCSDGRPVFVGFNAPFDWMFVADAFHRSLGRNPFGISALDLKAAYFGRERVRRWAETRRSFVLERYPIERVANHNALDDARAQAELAQLLLELPARPDPPTAAPPEDVT